MFEKKILDKKWIRKCPQCLKFSILDSDKKGLVKDVKTDKRIFVKCE